MDNTILRLSDIKTGQECVVVKVHGHGSFRNRIMEMGFVKGETVKVIKNAPLRDPIEYEVMGSHISLRRSEARLIEVVMVAEPEIDTYNGTLEDNTLHDRVKQRAHTINVALVGNPNCGKTSLYNRLTGKHERVGNYSGVTVDAKMAVLEYEGYTINMIDLPGTYSITEYTPEEIYVREYIAHSHPDIVLNVVDASSMERNLFLTTQLIDMNIRVVMALNMYDELQKEGAKLDIPHLSQLLGMPIVPTIASRGEGLNNLLKRIIDVFEDRCEESRHLHINYGSEIESAITEIKTEILPNKAITDMVTPRYAAIKLLENDRIIKDQLAGVPNYDCVVEVTKKEIIKLEREFKEDTKTIITNRKYGFIRGALQETYQSGNVDKRHMTNAIDTILTNHWLGFPFLIIFMWIMFQATFTLGSYPMDWIEMGVEWLGNYISTLLPPGALNDLIADGIISGVGGVIVFLPNILILFFFISLMEDTGYMARVAFIMDKMMHKIGLHGKSFIPLLIGFGCNVPAIMATRTLQSRRDRVLTMLIIPFMSCSARLPVYILLVSAFFEHNQGLVLMSFYLIGLVIAVCTALVLKHTLFNKESEPFVMELPPYRMPTLRNTTVHMWNKAGQYLKKMGTIILFASIIIWALGYFPNHNREDMTFSEHMEQSYIGQIGHAVEPVMAPLGFDWKMSVSIITGLAAKEIVVSSMGILYNLPDEEIATPTLVQTLKEQTNAEGNRVFTPLVAYSFMLFILIYFPCMAVIAAIRKEAGWKWALFTIFYTTILAWIVSCIVYQIGSLFN
ncbi:MAG: ferrous iron transport protein B [Marinifilaceae bacterium]